VLVPLDGEFLDLPVFFRVQILDLCGIDTSSDAEEEQKEDSPELAQVQDGCGRCGPSPHDSHGTPSAHLCCRSVPAAANGALLIRTVASSSDSRATYSQNPSSSKVILAVARPSLDHTVARLTVNAIASSWFETRMGALLHQESQYQEQAMRRVPMGRMGQPDELVGAVLYLASNASRMVTGHLLAVDGGTLAA
jgi:hypothetical protein